MTNVGLFIARTPTWSLTRSLSYFFSFFGAFFFCSESERLLRQVDVKMISLLCDEEKIKKTTPSTERDAEKEIRWNKMWTAPKSQINKYVNEVKCLQQTSQESVKSLKQCVCVCVASCHIFHTSSFLKTPHHPKLFWKNPGIWFKNRIDCKKFKKPQKITKRIKMAAMFAVCSVLTASLMAGDGDLRSSNQQGSLVSRDVELRHQPRSRQFVFVPSKVLKNVFLRV